MNLLLFILFKIFINWIEGSECLINNNKWVVIKFIFCMVIKLFVFMNYNKLYEIMILMDGYIVDILIFWYFLVN